MKPAFFAARSALTVLAALTLGGCYTTTIHSGKPAARPSIAYDEKWHSGVVWGIGELSGPYDLKEVCPGGWAEIKTETSFVNGFVEAVTSGIYSPQTVTVRCAEGGVAPAPSVATAASAAPAAAEPEKSGDPPAPPTQAP